MEKRHWTGVFPAITTPFHPDLTVDHDALAAHVTWMVDSGCTGIVALGSLGESATLAFDEKVEILRTCHRAVGARVPIVAGVAGLSTAECVALARAAEGAGCEGLMVMPAYVHVGDWKETRAHYAAVFGATPLSCMLYNNPLAYRTNVTPAQLADLAAEHANLHSVKESSGDVRRVTEIREIMGDRVVIFAGIDDMILEAMAVGATGWIAGMVNAMPEESVRVFELAATGRWQEAMELYHWFLPLLRLDTVPKFVQLIKLAQAEVGRGTTTVRPPRLDVEGEELEAALTVIRAAVKTRPALPASGGPLTAHPAPGLVTAATPG